jgi:hypothetical protein
MPQSIEQNEVESTNREIMMETNLSTKTRERQSKEHTTDSRELNPKSNG